MRSWSITVKIWLSVGVYILGYAISVSLTQMQSRAARASFRTTSTALFPAAQQGQQATAAFQREVTEFSNAALTQDAAGVDQAAREGQSAVSALKSIAAIPGIAADRSKEAADLAASIEALSSDSQAIYRTAVTGTLTPETQAQLQTLASRTNQAKAALATFEDQSAEDLHRQLGTLEDQSASQSTAGLVLFLITLATAGGIVHWTIRASITGPVAHAVSELAEGAAQISAAAAQVASSSQTLAQDSSHQAASIEETSSVSTEINSMAKRNTESSRAAAQMVTRSEASFQKTNQSLAELVNAMDGIGASSQKISKIIKVIDEIAFQTNILALNAAVEAARAGESGMGFAVVADEVRNLAQRSAQAARDTADLIEDSIQRSAEGRLKVDQVGTAIGEITSESSQIKGFVDQISLGSAEQSSGVDEMTRSIERMEQMTHSNAANAEESAAAAEELSAQSQAMKTVVEGLRRMLEGGHAIAGDDVYREGPRRGLHAMLEI
jgi:methyl-accepting chemotaxis protein